LNNVVLLASHKDGSVTEGEDKIPKANKPIDRVFLRPGESEATPEALRAIREADLIVLGPGSLYTSIIPNLLIKDITSAIAASRAIKVYVCNVMTQPGETDGYSASNHLKALIEHSHPGLVDYCIVNTGKIPQDLLSRYTSEQAFQVVNDRKKIEQMGYRVIEDDTILIQNFIRHDPLKLARIILDLLEEI
jgi:uncharacterized cofD-like protein